MQSYSRHLNECLASHIPSPGSTDRILDFGCGDGVHREFCEQLGYEWIGIDVNSREASVLGDGRRLPFSAESFECVLSTAVLEHVNRPRLAVKEVTRVLKSGGKFIGTVASLEDFHGKSFFHHTHYGIYDLLRDAGLEINIISPYDIINHFPAVKWEGPLPQTRQLFPGVPEAVQLALGSPLYFLYRVWFALGGMIDQRDSKQIKFRARCALAGQFAFVADKNKE
ncbi:class I SAM-dependent methyltransferase [Salinibacter ruber]|uniref:class I SAM-dependent methyltransferase n=1 Tax=Salinibacter ruber TaxID=146919 RepID=UPI0015E13C65|nr:class I SAM-dependent methyltransferase [Salinibacter ruber]